ncbi:MAG: hypothetical protein KBS81_04260 [Spirochaetales bacterium]|nr:hypothetical protein [Candidatus Physcosoma equi]
MLIFDTLDELESYSSIVPHMNDVITVMDHGTPYDDGPGIYDCSSRSKNKYVVSAHLSSETGFKGENYPEHKVLEVCLEGEEMVSVDGSVFKMSQGRFLVYEGDATIKRGIMFSTPVAFKTVRFIL